MISPLNATLVGNLLPQNNWANALVGQQSPSKDYWNSAAEVVTNNAENSPSAASNTSPLIPLASNSAPVFVGGSTATPPLGASETVVSAFLAPSAAGTSGFPGNAYTSPINTIANSSFSWITWLTWGFLAWAAIGLFRHFFPKK
jgi:hypothetical protein